MTRIITALLASAAMLAACQGDDTPANDAADAATEGPADAPPAGDDAGQDDDGGGDGGADDGGNDQPPGNDNGGDDDDGDAPLATIPARFHGEWNSDLAACGRTSETRLIVSGDRLRFYESSGTVREVDRESDRVISVAAAYQGEGESWTNTRRLELSPNGNRLTVSGEGSTLTRRRCP